VLSRMITFEMADTSPKMADVNPNRVAIKDTHIPTMKKISQLLEYVPNGSIISIKSG